MHIIHALHIIQCIVPPEHKMAIILTNYKFTLLMGKLMSNAMAFSGVIDLTYGLVRDNRAWAAALFPSHMNRQCRGVSGLLLLHSKQVVDSIFL
jgi:hypothetical protein